MYGQWCLLIVNFLIGTRMGQFRGSFSGRLGNAGHCLDPRIETGRNHLLRAFAARHREGTAAHHENARHEKRRRATLSVRAQTFRPQQFQKRPQAQRMDQVAPSSSS